MKVIRRTKTGISVRKEKRRLPILGVSLFFPRWSSSLRRHYFLIFDPDVIFSYLLWRKRSRKDVKGAGNIWLSNLTGSGDENPGRNPRFHRLLCFEQQLLMFLIVLYSLAASNKLQVDDHSAEVGVDVFVFRSVFRAFDTKMSIKYRFNHFVKGFVTERVVKIVQTYDVTVYYIWLLKKNRGHWLQHSFHFWTLTRLKWVPHFGVMYGFIQIFWTKLSYRNILMTAFNSCSLALPHIKTCWRWNLFHAFFI